MKALAPEGRAKGATPLPRQPAGDISRAELLLALSLAPAQPDARERLAEHLRFVLRPQRREALTNVPDRKSDASDQTAQQPQQRQPILESPARPVLSTRLLVPVQREQHPPAPENTDTARSTRRTPPAWVLQRPKDAQGRALLPPAAPTLLKPTQWWPALRGSATFSFRQGLNLPQLVSHLARQQPLKTLPLRELRAWGSQLWVMADGSDRMAPYEEDLLLMLRLLLRMRGPHGLHVRRIPGSPDAWEPTAEDPAELPPPGTVVLVLSDMGVLAPQPALAQAWQRHVRRWLQAGARPICWAPLSPAQVPQPLARLLPVHCLAPGAGLKRQPGRHDQSILPAAERARLAPALRDLEALVSCSVRLDAGLLREMRLLSPALRRQPALEALYWADTQRVSTSRASRTLRPQQAAAAREHFGQLPQSLQSAAGRVLRQQHAHGPYAAQALEATLWEAWVQRPPSSLSHEEAHWVEQGQACLQGLADFSEAAADADPNLAPFAHDVMHHQGHDARWQQANAMPLAALWAVSGASEAPACLPAEVLLSAQARRRPATGAGPKGWWLMERYGQLQLWPGDRALPRYASPVHRFGAAAGIAVRAGAKGTQRLIAADDPALQKLPVPDGGDALWITTDSENLKLEWRRRPAWAEAWGRDAVGLWVQARTLMGALTKMRPTWQHGRLMWTPLGEAPPDGSDPATDSAQAPERLQSLVGIVSTGEREWGHEVAQALAQMKPTPAIVQTQIGFSSSQEWQAWLDGRDRARLALIVVLVTEELVRSVREGDAELAALLFRARHPGVNVLPVALSARPQTGTDWDKLQWLPVGLRANESLLAYQPQAEAQRTLEKLVTTVEQRLAEMALLAQPPAQPDPSQSPLSIWLAADDTHGPASLFADLTLRSSHSPPVTQRFRWLPPGEFMMGSPDLEPERDEDEGPQHLVRLTQGFWLADTACTQALWLAVMGGENPAHFQDDLSNPVEQVSWDDVQKFLERVQAWLPAGCEAVLPTEAQWEFACRAGTLGPFSFGDTISPEQVNYNGNYPYNGAPDGEYRQTTVAVRRLPPNDWGLYQMHGNVWEWCADPKREYALTARGVVIEDPGTAKPAPQARDTRAVRGGSWFGHARLARSAARYAGGRGARSSDLGFRLALRSGSTSPASAERPAQPPGRAEPGQDLQGIAPGQGPVPAKRRDAASPARKK